LVVEDAPEPHADENSIRIAVRAASVNQSSSSAAAADALFGSQWGHVTGRNAVSDGGTHTGLFS
jgi:NADPH:quinone reductase-like Zn-dependent oxidoreductase